MQKRHVILPHNHNLCTDTSSGAAPRLALDVRPQCSHCSASSVSYHGAAPLRSPCYAPSLVGFLPARLRCPLIRRGGGGVVRWEGTFMVARVLSATETLPP